MRVISAPILVVAALFLGAPAPALKKAPSGSEEIFVEARKPPDRYLRDWREYKTAHFLVDSNLPDFVVAGLAQELERLRAVELRLLIAQPALAAQPVVIPGRVRLIASSASLLNELAHDEYFVGSGPGCQQLLKVPCHMARPLNSCAENLLFRANYFVSRLGEPTIILPVIGLNVNSEVVAHEVAHHLASHLFLNPPPWFQEGFAAFLQTLGSETLENPPMTGSQISGGERFIAAAAGLPAPAFEHALCRDWISAKKLLQWQGRQTVARTGAFHIQSWLLYHWLRSQRSKELTEFQSRLASGEDSAAAWRQALPEFDPDKPGALQSLDDALEQYYRRGGGLYFRTKADADVTYSEAPLPPADVHMLLIDARYSVAASRDESSGWLRSELHNLLLEEPLHPVTLAWRAELDHSSPLTALRRATTRWPTDWRAWLLLGQAAVAAAEKETAYRTALSLNPDSALVLVNLALFLARSGRPLEALSFAEQALELAPWDASATATLSAVDALLGHCHEALQLRERARRLSSRAPAFALTPNNAAEWSPAVCGTSR